MNHVLVIDKNKQPLMPCHPARARHLLKAGKATVLRRFPFTILLTERSGGDTQPTQIKLDPGSRTTGVAIVIQGKRGHRVKWAAEISHRGHTITKALATRRAQRRN